MENIIDQKQIDKVVELNQEFAKANESLQKMTELTKKLGIGENKIDWEEKYYDAVELLTIRENKIKELESHITVILKGNRERESEIRRQEIVIQAYQKDNEALRKRLKDKYWRLFEKIAPYFILLIFSLGLMFHLI